MEPLTQIAFVLGVVAYSASATLFFVNMARRQGAPLAATWGPRALLIGAASHAAHLNLAAFATMTCPVASLPFALSLSALITSIAYLLLRNRLSIDAMGVAVAPIALVFMVTSQFVGRSASHEMPGTLLAFHITANLLGLGLFLLAGAAGAFYLFQERRLKNKRKALLGGRLPPLAQLELTEHRLLLAGFPLLTFGVVTGAFFMGSLSQLSLPELMRIALAYVAWILVAAVLLLRSVAGWSGRRAAYGTLAGVACVLLVMLAYVIRAGGGST
jgi:ABC-type uncharacterized transport system permease subunit